MRRHGASGECCTAALNPLRGSRTSSTMWISSVSARRGVAQPSTPRGKRWLCLSPSRFGVRPKPG
eukprot:5921197-Lingulodinium_polyedra.AAC.1